MPLVADNTSNLSEDACNPSPPTLLSFQPSSCCTVHISFALQYVQNEAALLQAAKSGVVATVRKLLDEHISVNSTDEVGLCYVNLYVLGAVSVCLTLS